MYYTNSCFNIWMFIQMHLLIIYLSIFMYVHLFMYIGYIYIHVFLMCLYLYVPYVCVLVGPPPTPTVILRGGGAGLYDYDCRVLYIYDTFMNRYPCVGRHPYPVLPRGLLRQQGGHPGAICPSRCPYHRYGPSSKRSNKCDRSSTCMRYVYIYIYIYVCI
jgi:hypothetical protein